MIIDTSAVLAILLGEPDAGRYEDAIAAAWPRRTSVVALLEAAMVVESRGGVAAGEELDTLLDKSAVELVSVTPEHVTAAREGRSTARHRAMNEGVATKGRVGAEIATLRAEMHALLLKTAVGIVIANVSIAVAPMKLLP